MLKISAWVVQKLVYQVLMFALQRARGFSWEFGCFWKKWWCKVLSKLRQWSTKAKGTAVLQVSVMNRKREVQPGIFKGIWRRQDSPVVPQQLMYLKHCCKTWATASVSMFLLLGVPDVGSGVCVLTGTSSTGVPGCRSPSVLHAREGNFGKALIWKCLNRKDLLSRGIYGSKVFMLDPPFILLQYRCCFLSFHYARAAPKGMLSMLLCWPTTSGADVGGMAAEVESSHQCSITFCCWGAEGHSDRMASDVKVHMKQRCIPEFLHVGKKKVLTDIHQHLLNISGDQTGDVSTVRRWVVRFMSATCSTFITGGNA